jgi:hypothetical protein
MVRLQLIAISRVILQDCGIKKTSKIRFRRDQEPDTSLHLEVVVRCFGDPNFRLAETALSTMDAKYIALSQLMRELNPIWEVILEMQKIVFGGWKVLACRSHSKMYEQNGTVQ